MADEIPPIVPPQPPGVGLINTAPGLMTATPNTAAPTSGAPVTGFNPAQATATQATATPFTVAPKATVQGQLKEILASGSPLLEEAEANARQFMSGRGLINSTIALSAGRKALYDTALPIATTDAGTYDRAATNTAATENNFALTNAAANTDVSKFNSGQTNASLAQAAEASNAVGLTKLQGDIQKELERIRGDITLGIAEKEAASRQQIAQLQAASNQQIAQLQADTGLTEQQRAIEAQKVLQGMQDTLQREIARINSDTSLSIVEKQAATQRLQIQSSGQTARDVQQLQNAGALANIQANGAVSSKLADIDGRYKLLIQNSAGAAQIWSNALQFMNNVVMNPDINPEQKNEYLNNKVQEVNDALDIQSRIAGTPQVSSLLNYSLVGNDQGGGSARGTLTPAPTTPATGGGGAPAANDNTAAIQNLYSSVLGRGADPAGLAYWTQQVANGMPLDAVRNSMQASDEYKRMTGTG